MTEIMQVIPTAHGILENVWIDLVSKQRAEKKFNHEQPVTPISLIKEITSQLSLNKDSSIGVMFTVEWALYLKVEGYTNITLITDTFDRIIYKWCKKMSLDYLVLNQSGIENMKFDIVVGNPPYQGTGRKKIYINFMEKSLELVRDGGFFSFVTPKLGINFLFGSEVSQRALSDFYNIILVNVSDSLNRHFPDIGSDFSYFLVEKSSYKGNTVIIHNNGITSIQMTWQSVLPFDQDLSIMPILNKCLNVNANEWGRKAARITEDIEGGKNKLIYSIGKKGPKIWYTDNTHDDMFKNKVLFTTLGKYYIIDEDANLFPASSFTPYILTNSVKESNNLVKLFHSKLFVFLESVFKSARSPSDYIWRNLRKIPLIGEMTDAEIYAHFGLTQEEIDYIEANVK